MPSNPSPPSGSQAQTEAAPGHRERQELLSSLRWPLTLVILAILALLGYWITLDRAAAGATALTDAAGSAVGAAADRIQDTVEGFFSGDVTESFISEMPKVDRSGQGRLEVARAEIVETLSRSDERRMAWDTLTLGTTTVEIQLPVTYRYHLRLEETWKVEVHGPVCLVEAPALRPSLPPAIHTDRMRSRSEESWLRFDATERMDELRRSLTPRLEQRARSEHHMALVREEARRTVANFVGQWLLGKDYWADDRFATIRVRFADEPEVSPADLESSVLGEPRIEIDLGQPTGPERDSTGDSTSGSDSD